ncbi:MAG: DHH family phosphoesterase [Theionarchaea archaeon]|nr:DHH family phosphoesterase [Theionarchaea archaeon]MBU7037902.1 DHH family phosphoesterase [Theionarchaea archaeon]
MVPVYVMLGCGWIGRLLLKKESRFKIVDPEGDILEKEGYSAVKGDPGDHVLWQTIGLQEAAVVVILDRSVSSEEVRNHAPNAYIIIVHSERGSVDLGADHIIPTEEMMACECYSQIEYVEKKKRKDLLQKALQSGTTMAIIMHDNPDPDCISSALSLKLVAQNMGVTSDLYYGGQIGFLENKALVDLLELILVPPSPDSQPDFSRYDLTAFVDHSPWDYTSIARDINPDIVIDHHLFPDYQGKFVDVREDVGATSTILTEYLELFNIEITPRLGTALFYGLLVDTNGFRRGISEQDIRALNFLQDKIDTEFLSQIERAGLARRATPSHETSDFLNVMGEAVKNMEVKDGVVFSFVGKVHYRDAVSNSADFLLKMQRLDVVIVYGIIGDILYVSARSWNEDLHMGKLLRKAFHQLGRAGGHPMSAGAAIPLSRLSENFEDEIISRIMQVYTQS